MIRCAESRLRCGSQVIMIMWNMMLMMMTRVDRMLSLVTDKVVVQLARGHSVRTVGVRRGRGRGSEAVRRLLARSRFMSARLHWLRGLEILGLFLLALLVRRPFVLEPCVESLGRPLWVKKVHGGGRKAMKESVTSVRCKPTTPCRTMVGVGMAGKRRCSHGNTLCQRYPLLERRVIVLFVKLVESGQLIGRVSVPRFLGRLWVLLYDRLHVWVGWRREGGEVAFHQGRGRRQQRWGNKRRKMRGTESLKGHIFLIRQGVQFENS